MIAPMTKTPELAESRIETLLSQLTLEEKTSLLSGSGMWTVPGVPRLGIPGIKVTDGPNGARGNGLLGSGLPALCIPCGSALGATFDPALIEALGVALGEESRTKQSHVLLAPTINIHRSPLGGRNFECYSEDPLLSGKIAAAFVRGVQSQHVGCTPKHFAGNDAEFERNTIDSLIDDRALREIYLRPFEIAIREGGAWGLMGAYNRLNGTFCCEHPWLLTEVLKKEWGFDGVVVTDWFANRSTAGSAAAGLDLEMPGPGRQWGEGRLADAVQSGDLDEGVVDEMVRRMLRLMERTRAFDRPMESAEESVDRADHRALARRAAAASMVLLRNEHETLPFDRSALRKLAVIGPNADAAQIMGGGSAKIRAFHYTTPLAALRARLGDEMEIVYERGCVTHKTAPPLMVPVAVDIFDDHDLGGEPIAHRSHPQSKVLVVGGFGGASDRNVFSMRARMTFAATESGIHRFSMVCAGWAKLFVDGALVIDAWKSGVARGEDLFGMGSVELVGEVEIEAGREVEIVLEMSSREAILFCGAELGCYAPALDDGIERAAAAAAEADAALVIVGTNDDWETEGHDRSDMGLPGRSDALVAAVIEANPRTAVVVNAGAPVAMPWAEDAPAILDIWFGGQEMAEALVDVLFGDVSPSGKLPMTFPRKLEHNPAFPNFPGENSRVRYGESIFVGYRHYDATDRDPLFCFGHGLGYAPFEVCSAEVDRDRIKVGQGVRVSARVRNVGTRRAAEVLQCYVAPERSHLQRPPRELVAFEKIWLDPGEERAVVFDLGPRAFSYWDPGDPVFETLAAGLPVPSGGGKERRKEAGWAIDSGRYGIVLGTSSRDLRAALALEIE